MGSFSILSFTKGFLLRFISAIGLYFSRNQQYLHFLSFFLFLDFLLCRGCGNDIGITRQLIYNKVSPDSKHIGNESLFDLDEVLVQDLVNPLGIRFRVVLLDPSVKKVDCQARISDNWVAIGSWFPNYAWKACHCAKCGAHLGKDYF